jgi:hypothetical protein
MTGRIQLGDRVRDRITEYEGIAIARTEWLYGCVRLGVQRSGVDKDGKPFEPQTFDEGQLVVVDAGVLSPEKSNVALPPGGPRQDFVTRPSDPRR